ncbi:MAG TPA: hypothetical protein VJ777_04065 [Mycobacterium sp.]|nr:hypothetical protein [Mycobacterium sp.]
MTDALRHDIRYSLRTLAKSPVFTAVITLSLAIGIGANTALFSLVDGLLLRTLPLPSPERLVQVAQPETSVTKQTDYMGNTSLQLRCSHR